MFAVPGSPQLLLWSEVLGLAVSYDGNPQVARIGTEAETLEK